MILRAYKIVLSPLFAGSCRFAPSCADYARDAVLEHGALRGTGLAALRILRCHPLCAAGYDPVPRELSPFAWVRTSRRRPHLESLPPAK